jgi:hypothetical protein
MTGTFIITAHALARFRRRFQDPEADDYDLGLILAQAKIVRHERLTDEHKVYAQLEDCVFAMRVDEPGVYTVLTVIRLEGPTARHKFQPQTVVRSGMSGGIPS